MSAKLTSIRRLDAAEAEAALAALADILVDAVASGASVNFLTGCDTPTATAFWRGQLPGIADGSRILLVATMDGAIVGTVVIALAHQQNSPFRAEIGKMLVHSSKRGCGIGRSLLVAAEATAADLGRTLLLLDTETGSAGERLYRACGWTVLGTVPDFCLANDGSLVSSTYFYKHLGRPSQNRSAGRVDARIRPATSEDLPAILAIYNDAVVGSTAIWNWSPVDLANRQAWFSARMGQGYPILVVEGEAGAEGYASFGDWRPFDGYRHTVEHSLYVAQAARGRGHGRALLEALIAEARALGKHVILGGIDATNEASLALHRSLGFAETARMPQVGRKFERWLDLVFMQKNL